MGKFGNFLKKAVGTIASIAAPVVKNIPFVGNFAGSALNSISQKLLQSPTPIKESAAQLVQAPVSFSADMLKAAGGSLAKGYVINSISPVKESSQALQLKLQPTPSNSIKASSYDLTGITQSNLLSDAKKNAPAKDPNDLATGAGAPKKKDNMLMYVLIGIAAFFFMIFLIPQLSRRRR